MKHTNAIIYPNVEKNLKILGENIKLARLRRNLPMSLICERAGISKPTLIKIEKGSPDVSMGMYAMVLNALNNSSSELTKVMREDELGRTIQDLNIKLPKRARRWKNIIYRNVKEEPHSNYKLMDTSIDGGCHVSNFALPLVGGGESKDAIIAASFYFKISEKEAKEIYESMHEIVLNDLKKMQKEYKELGKVLDIIIKIANERG